MRKINKFLFILFLIGKISLSTLYSQSNDIQIKICKWYDNAACGVSFSFDDGSCGHYKLIVPLLEDYGFKGSFSLIGKSIIRDKTVNIWREISEKGHEISNHSFSHVYFVKGVPYDTVFTQVYRNYFFIQDSLKTTPITFIYPGGARNEMTNKIIFSRHLINTFEPKDFCSVRNIVSKDSAEVVINRIKKEITDSCFLDLVGHGVFSDSIKCGGWQPVNIKLYNEVFSYIKKQNENEMKIWVAPLRDIGRYKIERDNTKLIINKIKKNKIELFVDIKYEHFNAKMLNIPLTVKINNIENIRWIKEKQIDGKYKIIQYRKDGNSFYFNVLPRMEYNIKL